MRHRTFNWLSYGLWTVVLIFVLVIEVLPVFLFVTAFSLAVGVPQTTLKDTMLMLIDEQNK